MRRWVRLLAAVAAAVLLLLTAAMATVVASVALGVTIDVSRWRDVMAGRAATALGRPVLLESPVALTLGRETVLQLGRVRVLNPAGFPATEFAELRDVRARFDLFDAVRGRLQVRGVEGNDGRLLLERTVDGHANWVFVKPSTDGPGSTDGIGDIVLRRVSIDYHDARTKRRLAIAVDELSGRVEWNQPLRVSLRGRAAGQYPYALTVEGGPGRLLEEATAPWPFDLAFEFLGARLRASGAIDAVKGEARFQFAAHGENLAQVERFLDRPLPRFGAIALDGTAVAGPDAIQFDELRGRWGESEFSGRLRLTREAERPRVSGALTVGTLDLRPLTGAEARLRGVSPGDGAPSRGGPKLRDLVPIDAEIDLQVERWLGLPADVQNARIELRADARGVQAPVAATVAGMPFSGRVVLDTAAPLTVLTFHVDAKEPALGNVVGALGGTADVEGTLGRIGLRAVGRGDTLGALMENLDLALTVENARGRYRRGADGRPTTFALDRLEVMAPPRERLRGSARGAMQGERVALSFRGGILAEMLRAPVTPIQLDLTAGSAKLQIEGAIALAGTAAETDLTFGLRARRAGDLAPWVPVAPNSRLALALHGRVRVQSDGWRIDDTRLRIGRSEVTIDAHRMSAGTRPMTTLAVRSPLIDVPELATLRPGGGSRAAGMDSPLGVEEIGLQDADIDLDLERVAFGRFDLLDVGFAGRFLEGLLPPSPIAATFAGMPFEGRLAVDARGDVPDASLELSAAAVDAGALLRNLGVAENIEGRADALEVGLRARGRTPREFVARSSLVARVSGGSLAVRPTAARPGAQIRLDQATVDAPAGSPAQIRLAGSYDGEPADIHIVTGSLADLVSDARRLPVSATATAADARFALRGDLLLPLGRGGEFTVVVGGERLDALSGLAGVELPAWGPWSLRGPVRMAPTGYEVPALAAQVGTSTLAGSAGIDVAGPRPRLVMNVTAPSVQLDDFPLPERLTDDPPQALTAAGIRATASGVARRTERLLNAGFLRRFDTYLDIDVQEVLSGRDRLAHGALRIQVIDGRLHLGPARVDLPDGTLTLAVAYDPTASEIDLKAGAYIERFDYGILARRRQPGENVRGLFSARVEVSGRASSLDEIMRHADGKVDFAVWPEELGGGIFNLWSVNLLLAVLPVIDPRGESHVNCIVGRFNLRDGVVSDDKILIDTTRVRVRGAGSANLRTEEVDFVFRPRAKGLALFRLQNPLRVTGTFTDYHIGIDRRELLGSTLRMLASPILVPWEWLTRGPLPRDGSDVCTDPLRQ